MEPYVIVEGTGSNLHTDIFPHMGCIIVRQENESHPFIEHDLVVLTFDQAQELYSKLGNLLWKMAKNQWQKASFTEPLT